MIELLKHLKLFSSRGGKNKVHPIPVHTATMRNQKVKVAREYNYIEVLRVWYSLPSFLLSNFTSLPNRVDELTVTVCAVSADTVVITKT